MPHEVAEEVDLSGASTVVAGGGGDHERVKSFHVKSHNLINFTELEIVRALGGSGHEVFIAKLGGAPVVYKANKDGRVHASLMEVAYTYTLAALLNTEQEQMVKPAHLVRDGENIVGVAVEMHGGLESDGADERFKDFKEVNLVNLLAQIDRNDDDDRAYLDGVRSGGHNLERQVLEFLDSSELELRQKLVKQYFKAVEMRTLCQENDGHKGNYGFVIKTDLQGHISDINIVPIDFDLMFYDFTSRFIKGLTNFQLGQAVGKFDPGKECRANFHPGQVTDISNGTLITTNKGLYTCEDVRNYEYLKQQAENFKRQVREAREEVTSAFIGLEPYSLREYLGVIGPDSLQAEGIQLTSKEDKLDFPHEVASKVCEIQRRYKDNIKVGIRRLKPAVKQGKETKESRLKAYLFTHPESPIKKFVEDRIEISSEAVAELRQPEESELNLLKRMLAELDGELSDADIKERKLYALALCRYFVGRTTDVETLTQYIEWWQNIGLTVITRSRSEDYWSKLFKGAIYNRWTVGYVSVRDMLLTRACILGRQGVFVGPHIRCLESFGGWKKPGSDDPVSFANRFWMRKQELMHNDYTDKAWYDPRSKSGMEYCLAWVGITQLKDLVKIIAEGIPMLLKEIARSTARGVYWLMMTNVCKKTVIPYLVLVPLFIALRVVQHTLQFVSVVQRMMFSPIMAAEDANRWGTKHFGETVGSITYGASLLCSFVLYVALAKAVLVIMPLIGLTVAAKAVVAFATSTQMGSAIYGLALSALVVIQSFSEYFSSKQKSVLAAPAAVGDSVMRLFSRRSGDPDEDGPGHFYGPMSVRVNA